MLVYDYNRKIYHGRVVKKSNQKMFSKIIDEVKDGKHSTKWVTYYTGHLQKI